MSVSIVMVPVAIAMAALMGTKKLTDWVREREIRVPSNFENQQDVLDLMKKAGLMAEEHGGVIKVHFEDSTDFFIWAKRAGRWTAIFSNRQSHDLIDAMLTKLESVAQLPVFDRDSLDGSFEIFSNNEFPTNFKEEAALMKTLTYYGLNPVVHTDGKITCRVGEGAMELSPHEGSHYTLSFSGIDEEEVFKHLLIVDEEYKRHIQERTYEEVLKMARTNQMMVENEEVLEDNSVVLTLRID